MALQSKIREDLQIATKERDQSKMDTLRAVLAGCINEAVAIGKAPQEELSDEAVLSVIKRLVKQRKDSIDQFTTAGRVDLIAGEQAQIWVLEQYLPAQLSDSDLRIIASKKKVELGIVDKTKIGILIGAVMKEVGNQADGSLVKKVAESLFE